MILTRGTAKKRTLITLECGNCGRANTEDEPIEQWRRIEVGKAFEFDVNGTISKGGGLFEALFCPNCSKAYLTPLFEVPTRPPKKEKTGAGDAG